MLPWTGRIYHPGPSEAGGVGLIRSAMAIDWSSLFEFGADGDQAPPEAFTWNGTLHKLTNELLDVIKQPK